MTSATQYDAESSRTSATAHLPKPAPVMRAPTLLIYIFLGRYFLRGMMTGTLKE